jgi:hypothetical protein
MPAGQALPAFFEPQKRAGVITGAIKQAILQKAPVLCAPACHRTTSFPRGEPPLLNSPPLCVALHIRMIEPMLSPGW